MIIMIATYKIMIVVSFKKLNFFFKITGHLQLDFFMLQLTHGKF